jgi:glycyl-tRNA synthetase beta chain
VSIADKLDTFVSLSKAGERATGSRDPFGLRRQMQGAIRILMDLPQLTGIDREVWLGPLLARAGEGTTNTTGAWTDDGAEAALAFAVERIRFALEHRGFGVEVVRAATPAGDISPLRARRIAEAIQGMRASDDFQALAVLFKRVKNIARERRSSGALDRGAISEPAERALLDELDAKRPKIETAAGRSDYRSAFVEIAGLRAAVDRFFTEVFVMAEDVRVRDARLTLMADLRDLILNLADISEIIPQTE